MAKSKASKIVSHCKGPTSVPIPLVPKPLSFNAVTNILLIPIHVKPNAKESKLEPLIKNITPLPPSEEQLEFAFNMHVAAPPQDGEANTEVIQHTSKVIIKENIIFQILIYLSRRGGLENQTSTSLKE